MLRKLSVCASTLEDGSENSANRRVRAAMAEGFQFWDTAFPEADTRFGFRFLAKALNSAQQ
jgi:hypothetical protein